MEDFDLTLALNSKQIAVKVHSHIENDRTYYDVLFDDYSVSIYKDTLYTWASDDPQALSAAEIQSIGEQIDNPQ